MINRVLIRIKVVQMLYSYLLVENTFAIEPQPESPTREKRFAYSLYLDMLAMMTSIASEITRRGGDSPLYDTRFIQRVSREDRVRMLIGRHASGNWPLADAERQLTIKVKESGLYKKFLKSENPGSQADEKIWQEIFNTIIMADPALNQEIAKMENYSLSGVERMRGLMDQTFTNFYSSSDHLPDALKTLALSMDKARELYFRLLDLPVRLVAMREAQIEEQRNKYLATPEDRNPNMRFVENELVDYLRHSEQLDAALNRYGRSMSADDDPMLMALLRAIMSSDLYKEYMEMPATDFEHDCEFWRNVYRQIIFDNPDFLEALEDKSVFWNDDLYTIGTFVVKTVRRISDHMKRREEQAEKDGDLYPVNDAEVLLPMYKDDEDARFGSELFSAVVNNKDTYRQYIDHALDTSIWEADRMAYMDVIVMMAAIAEMLNFPSIPLKVTVNEYIEIAKSYSTGKSGQFVNGMLGDIVKYLKSEGKLLK